jgi:hypothetical protein
MKKSIAKIHHRRLVPAQSLFSPASLVKERFAAARGERLL